MRSLLKDSRLYTCTQYLYKANLTLVGSLPAKAAPNSTALSASGFHIPITQ
jgi:hypothetical protein